MSGSDNVNMCGNVQKSRSSIKDLIGERSGTTMVEFAILINLFFGIIFGIVYWGIWLWEYNTLQYATMQASRCTIMPSGTPSRICGTANSYGTENSYAVTPATPTTAGTGFSPTIETNLSVSYSCVQASYKSGLSDLFYFKDNRIAPKVCYTVP